MDEKEKENIHFRFEKKKKINTQAGILERLLT